MTVGKSGTDCLGANQIRQILRAYIASMLLNYPRSTGQFKPRILSTRPEGHCRTTLLRRNEVEDRDLPSSLRSPCGTWPSIPYIRISTYCARPPRAPPWLSFSWRFCGAAVPLRLYRRVGARKGSVPALLFVLWVPVCVFHLYESGDIVWAIRGRVEFIGENLLYYRT
jgi:hypothetical protein